MEVFLFLIFSDADEIPRREVITFLKLYDGYPEPFKLHYRWNMYGFFWEKNEGKKEIWFTI